MSKIIVILVLFLVLIGGVVLYKQIQASQVKKSGKVTINNHIFDVEVVKTDKDKQIGLTKYKSIKENQGMFFVFNNEGSPSFWMKNMKFSIDILFIENDTVVYLAENANPADPKTDPTIYKPDVSAKYVLEIKSGLIKKYNIKKGDKVKIEME